MSVELTAVYQAVPEERGLQTLVLSVLAMASSLPTSP